MGFYWEITDVGGDRVKRYDWPAKSMTPVDGMDAVLRGWRKEAIREREEFLNLQKDLGRTGDRTTAKIMKECASYQLQVQRACTLMLPWVGVPDTNQDVLPSSLWPIDLMDALDHVSWRLLLCFG